jgi:hypothetical protein
VGLLAPRAALAERRGRDLVVEVPGERSANNKLVLAGLAGGGALIGALGLYFHLDSRSAAGDVSAKSVTGRAWTPAEQALADRADRSATRAGIAYGIGGALLVGAAIAYIATEPESRTNVIHTGPAPAIIPARDSVGLGGTWTWAF